MTNAAQKFLVSFLFPLLISIGVIVYLGSVLDFTGIAKLVMRIEIRWVCLAACIVIGERFLVALRWQYLLASEGVSVPVKEIVPILFNSMFIGHLLPGLSTADLVRGYQIVRNYGKVGEITATLIVDRVIGLYSMLSLALVGALVLAVLGHSSDFLIVLLCSQFAFLVCWIAILRSISKLKSIQPFKSEKSRAVWTKVLLCCASVSDTRKIRIVFPKVFALSLTIQLTRCCTYYFLYRSLGADINLNPVYFLIFIPLVFIVLLIPLSFGGLGVREATLLNLFRTIGVTPELSVGVGFCMHILFLLISCPVFLSNVLRSFNLDYESKFLKRFMRK